MQVADDTLLLANTEEDLQRQIDELNESCTAFGMELSVKKDKGYGNGKRTRNENKNEVKWDSSRPSK